MKKFGKLLGFIVVFMMVMVVFCSVGFAEKIKYTDNLIPTMTSDTTPSGIVSVSSSYKDTSYKSWNAFDDSLSSAWCNNNAEGGKGWLAYEFPKREIIAKYTVTAASTGNNQVFTPSDWTFEALDNSNQWVILDTRKNELNWTAGEKREFVFNNEIPYKKYRINVTRSSGLVLIGKLEMMGLVTPQATSQLKLVLEVNGDKQLSVSEELSDNSEMDWKSFDSSIATVDENGKVKALKSGNTVITCTSKDKSYTESINVLVVDLEYQLAIDLNIGNKCRLTVDDSENSTNVTWSSYDSSIVIVSAKGKVTAMSEGLTYIVASDKDGKEIGRMYIRVRK